MPTRHPLDRLLGVFTEVRPGEGARALVMLLNILLVMISYYIIKTVREPLILQPRDRLTPGRHGRTQERPARARGGPR